MTASRFDRRYGLTLLLVPALLLAASDGDKVVTRRGNATVTLADVDAYVDQIPADQRAQFVIDRKRAEKMLDNLLLAEQLADEQRAAEEGKGTDPLLAARLRFVENEARAQFYLARIRDEAPPVDAALLAREAYTASPEKFVAPETRELRHVLVKTTARSEPQARALIDKVRAEALAGPERFADLAKEYSEDSSTAANGGLLPATTAAALSPKFAEAAFALAKPGEISPVIQTEFGLHIVQLVAVHPGKQLGFDEVRVPLEEQVRAEAAGRFAQQLIEKLRNIPAQTDDAVANSIRTRYDDLAATKAQ